MKSPNSLTCLSRAFTLCLLFAICLQVHGSFIVMTLDKSTGLLTVQPWTGGGVAFGASDELLIGAFRNTGFLIIDPPGGGRRITIPTSQGNPVNNVAQHGDKVTVTYQDGSTATVPGLYVPPNTIELNDNKGAGKPGTVELPNPPVLDPNPPLLPEDLQKWLDDFLLQFWDFNPTGVDSPMLIPGVNIWTSSIELDFGSGETVLVEAVPEPSQIVQGIALIALASVIGVVRRTRRNRNCR